jgi:purine-nucleoside phosphorylase
VVRLALISIGNNIKGLVLAAIEPELAGLNKTPPGWSVALTGIGGLASAASAARLLEATRPSKVLFVGTCGAYSPGLKIGDCIAASAAVAISVPEIQQRAYRPKKETAKWSATWALPLPPTVVASAPAITANHDDALLLGQVADAENLEVAGIFASCHQANVPVAAALAVSNQVGPACHAEWRENHSSVCKKLVAMLWNLGVFD